MQPERSPFATAEGKQDANANMVAGEINLWGTCLLPCWNTQIRGIWWFECILYEVRNFLTAWGEVQIYMRTILTSEIRIIGYNVANVISVISSTINLRYLNRLQVESIKVCGVIAKSSWWNVNIRLEVLLRQIGESRWSLNVCKVCRIGRWSPLRGYIGINLVDIFND